MGVDISQGGGGGGGITIETDPTALKIANNLSDLTNVETAKGWLGLDINSQPTFISVAASFEGTSTYYTHTGITFSDGSVQTTAGGGSSFNGGTITTPLTVSNSETSASIVLNSNLEGVSEVRADSGFGVYASLRMDGIQSTDGVSTTALGYNGITFPDGTVQTTAYTGGGGGVALNAIQQKYADAIASLTATPQFGVEFSDTMISVQWAVTFQFNNNSLVTEYPKFIDAMSSWYNIAVFDGANFFPVTYIDSTYLIGTLTGTFSFYGFIYIAVTDSASGGGFTDPTTTAVSFPAAFVNWSPA
jgi:hypothetical protein